MMKVLASDPVGKGVLMHMAEERENEKMRGKEAEEVGEEEENAMTMAVDERQENTAEVEVDEEAMDRARVEQRQEEVDDEIDDGGAEEGGGGDVLPPLVGSAHRDKAEENAEPGGSAPRTHPPPRCLAEHTGAQPRKVHTPAKASSRRRNREKRRCQRCSCRCGCNRAIDTSLSSLTFDAKRAQLALSRPMHNIIIVVYAPAKIMALVYDYSKSTYHNPTRVLLVVHPPERAFSPCVRWAAALKGRLI
jgi:hypothetical protein